ncbi:hypothetical protein Csa_013119 [Cucumis sativus]|uniref:Uncharacterized protein n=1 Tax=Cucumis sativus TaxID=3659 RepID=A0A0A0LRR2_CUCSA|nr:hypothetical protein Csa_013119 [Cucumis sativus]
MERDKYWMLTDLSSPSKGILYAGRCNSYDGFGSSGRVIQKKNKCVEIASPSKSSHSTKPCTELL